ncbi:MAG: endonuclease V [Thermoplasmata archaeon]|nr:MAG: endonuclease V [Thermoplasmata archaeon]
MIDLYSAMDEIVSSIPRGRVSTYRLAALALGDPIAARAFAARAASMPETAPYHRLVASDGRVGEFRDRPGLKARLLSSEGVQVIEGRVNLGKYLFEDLPRLGILGRLREEQERVRRGIRLEPLGEVHRIAAVDVAYAGDRAFAAAVIADLGGRVLETRTAVTEVRFPYIPTYLSYRELEPMLGALEGLEFDLILVDGNGVLHPRGVGIASHLGVLLGAPTIGVAKSLLVGEVVGDRVFLDGEPRALVFGYGRRKYYASPGHLCTLEDVRRILEPLMTKGGPSPLVAADRISKELKRRFMRHGVA